MRTKWIKALVATSVVAVSTFCTLAAIEMGLRFVKPNILQNDRELGWRLVPGVKRSVDNVRLDQTPYTATIAPNEMGLRESGSTANARLTMLVIGDSFTADPFSGDDDMWYVVGARQLEALGGLEKNSIHTLGGGAGGYGTLQELMLLRQLKKQVSPDLFVLQFCANDFINNHLAAESNGIVRSQYMKRPYYNLDGSISYSDSPYAWIWRSSLIGESKIFNKLDLVIQNAQFSHYHDYYKPNPPEVAAAYEKQMLAITSTLLKQIRSEVPDIPAVMVNCNGSPRGLNAQWEKIGKDAGFVVFTSPSDAVERSRGNKKLFYTDGAHLSPEGNLMFGQAFAKELVESGILSALLNKKH